MTDLTKQQMLGTGLRAISGEQGLAPYGLRHSGLAPKSLGYFGGVPNAQGGMSTEVSIEDEVNGKNMEYPLMVPTLNAQEMQSVIGGNPSEDAYRKALAHALQRQQQGLDPFAGPTDLRVPLP